VSGSSNGVPERTPTDLISGAAALREKGLTAEQKERRRVTRARAAHLQEHGVARGPNAHPDKTFGKVKP
jgi:hypothetical protein